MTEHVRVYEVGPRDGLQNESTPIPTAVKARFIELLAAAGLREIEATSFVAPSAIPQLADAEALMAGLHRLTGVRYPVLVPDSAASPAPRRPGPTPSRFSRPRPTPSRPRTSG